MVLRSQLPSTLILIYHWRLQIYNSGVYAYLGYIYRWLIRYFIRPCLLSSFARSLTADSIYIGGAVGKTGYFNVRFFANSNGWFYNHLQRYIRVNIIQYRFSVFKKQTSPLLSVAWSGATELNPLSKRFGILFDCSLLRIGSSVTVVTGYLRLLLIVGGTSLLT